MKNKTINLGVVAEIAQALGDLNESVVFVGGAVVSVYADGDAADEVRPTQDVDLTLTLFDFDQQDLDKQLAERDFHPDIHGHAICAYKYKDIAVDIMAPIDTMLGATNRWYAVGFGSLEKIDVCGTPIQVLSAPCFLATKFEAFHHRGQDDYRTSHDFEDIVYVIDNRSTIVVELEKAEAIVQDFIKAELLKVLNSPYLEEILSAHIHPLIVEQQYPMLLQKIMNMTK